MFARHSLCAEDDEGLVANPERVGEVQEAASRTVDQPERVTVQATPAIAEE